MKLYVKIILTTLIILVLALVINSTLSLISFNNLYVKSQISTFDLICKDLKRKIETSLRFGKKLDKFSNMEGLLLGMLEMSPNIDAIVVSDINGLLLYQVGGVSALQTIPDMALQIKDNPSSLMSTTLNQNKYYSTIDLVDRKEKQVGTICLIFSRDIIVQKLKRMGNETLSRLLGLILITSIVLFILLATLVVRPITFCVLDMKSILNSIGKRPRAWGGQSNTADLGGTLEPELFQSSSIKDEMDKLRTDTVFFANSMNRTIDRFDHLCYHQRLLALACDDFSSAKKKLLPMLSKATKEVNQDTLNQMEMFMMSLNHLDSLLKTLVHSTAQDIELANTLSGQDAAQDINEADK